MDNARQNSDLHPRLTLRVAVAGSRAMSFDDRNQAADRLAEIYSLLTETIETLAPGVPPFPVNPILVSYYKGKAPTDGLAPDPHAFPVLRLVGGLADGADQLAFRSLLDFKMSAVSTEVGPGRYTEYELVAVLPCEPIEFRNNSRVENVQEFDELLGECACVIELDGICDPKIENQPNPPLLSRRRERCFLAQARVLIRYSDILIAICSSPAEGRIGGTRQTILAAIQLGIPVIYVSVGADGNAVTVLEERADLDDDLTVKDPQWRDSVRRLVIGIVADPERSAGSLLDASEILESDDRQLLEEFFGAGTRNKSLRQRVWSRFENRFKRGLAPPRLQMDFHLDYFKRYRSRASEMNAHYVGKYRGAFLANYLLAPIAVSLAVSALVWVIFNLQVRFSEWVSFGVLITLAVLKLIVLITIYRNTRQGNDEHLNDQAIDARYLSERLRVFYYLPLLASLHVAPPRSARYAGRQLREKVVSWLLNAILRQSPAGVGLEPVDPPSEEMWQPAPNRQRPMFYRVNVAQAAQRINVGWLDTQIAYHGRQAQIQKRTYEWIESWMSVSNRLVILFVSFDLFVLILLVLASTFERSIHALEFLHTWSPMLLFFAAVLPAVVSSLNGLSFQSECKRIATRSVAMHDILTERRREWERFADEVSQMQQNPENPGSWVLRALDLAESCAQVVTDEVAEWSVLYSRDLTDI